MNIVKDIPLPLSPTICAERLCTMEIGDSHLVPLGEAQNWRLGMSRAASGGDFYFVSRTVEGGVRIWRKA